ncbi:MAG: D-alanine--poly(phosphoribitol) ligase subunit DltA [Blautia sp.]|nr:D-alanine--poly(phosphoribitol) ligase subunit DltA [Blautia sp.]
MDLDIIGKIKETAMHFPERTASTNGRDRLSYKELWEYSERLAVCLKNELGEEKQPLAVYGHKSPWMLVCFLACVKAGHGYCPIDISVPDARVEMILHSLPEGPVLAAEQNCSVPGDKEVWSFQQIQEICQMEKMDCCEPDTYVKGDGIWYMIFTSGSTGTPKGVQITADCLHHFTDWAVNLGGAASAEAMRESEEQNLIFLNQAPFSFDLSVMDLYTSLACGGTLYCLEKNVQADYRLLMEHLANAKANVWVSTPSFAEMCLCEQSFCADRMEGMRLFLFCGETLGNRTVAKLQQRFPEAVIINTYGPTESTVAVTGVIVTPEINEKRNPLPVGKAKPGTQILIFDENGQELPEGKKGEVIIAGNTVSPGYYGQPALTEKAFFEIDGMRAYRTGDRGYLENGQLFYCGRIDLQIKYHGYRIELEDIENNIRKLPYIEHVVVLPRERGGKVSSLMAYVVEKSIVEDEKTENDRLKQELLSFLPEYMVPKKFVFLDTMPMTANGKADRKKLGGGL